VKVDKLLSGLVVFCISCCEMQYHACIEKYNDADADDDDDDDGESRITFTLMFLA